MAAKWLVMSEVEAVEMTKCIAFLNVSCVVIYGNLNNVQPGFNGNHSGDFGPLLELPKLADNARPWPHVVSRAVNGRKGHVLFSASILMHIHDLTFKEGQLLGKQRLSYDRAAFEIICRGDVQRMPLFSSICERAKIFRMKAKHNDINTAA